MTNATVCAFVGEGEPEIVWSKDGKKIKPKKKDKRITTDWDVSDDTQSLKITDATVEDAGEYTVTVTNAGGSTSKTATVTVDKKIPPEKPKASKMPKSVTATEGETIRLLCKITGK